MTTTKQFQLIRILPSGQVKAWPDPFDSKYDAAVTAGQCLYDNVGTTKADSRWFARRLDEADLDTMVAHGSGYRFRIVHYTPTPDDDNLSALLAEVFGE